MEPKVLKTNDIHSDFLLYQTRLDLFNSKSLSDDQEGKPKTPHLAFLRVELTRLRAGMSDFLFKVSAPGPTPGSKPTVVTLRGDRNFAKLEGCTSAAKVVFREMEKRKDDTYTWSTADPAYLAKMLTNHAKFFVANINTDSLSFTTDALH